MKSNHMQRQGSYDASPGVPDRTGELSEPGRIDEARNAERPFDAERQESDGDQRGPSAGTQEDMVLHDDDEAELDLPR